MSQTTTANSSEKSLSKNSSRKIWRRNLIICRPRWLTGRRPNSLSPRLPPWLDEAGCPGTEPAQPIPGAGWVNQHGSQESAQLLQGHAPHELALICVGDRPGFLRHDHHDGVGLLAQADG